MMEHVWTFGRFSPAWMERFSMNSRSFSSLALSSKLLLLLLYSFHPIAEITLKNANIKDEFKGASTRIN